MPRPAPARTVLGSCHGVIPLEGRGALPFTPLRGRPLLHHAVETLRSVCEVTVTVEPERAEEARAAVPDGVALSSPGAFWAQPPSRVLLHDCLCPLVPAGFLRAIADRNSPAAAYRPVTDTLKDVDGDVVGGTVDRERFGVLTSPVLLLDLTQRPPTEDLARLVTWLRRRGPVDLVRSPPLGRRAVDHASVRLLECLDVVEHSGASSSARWDRR